MAILKISFLLTSPNVASLWKLKDWKFLVIQMFLLRPMQGTNMFRLNKYLWKLTVVRNILRKWQIPLESKYNEFWRSECQKWLWRWHGIQQIRKKFQIIRNECEKKSVGKRKEIEKFCRKCKDELKREKGREAWWNSAF